MQLMPILRNLPYNRGYRAMLECRRISGPDAGEKNVRRDAFFSARR
jgi:hypothetical protein